MTRELKSLEVANLPELLNIAENVRETGEPCVLTREGEEIALLSPVPEPPRRQRKTGIVTRGDSLWNVVGTASSEGPGDVARNKHQYLAEVYATKRT